MGELAQPPLPPPPGIRYNLKVQPGDHNCCNADSVIYIEPQDLSMHTALSIAICLPQILRLCLVGVRRKFNQSFPHILDGH